MSSACGNGDINGKGAECRQPLDKEHPRLLIPELCRLFYQLGWVTGTGGGISLRHGDHIYIAPSGVQKERIQVSNGRVTERTMSVSSSAGMNVF